MSELINQKQLEEALQISRSTIYRLRKEGMPFYTIGDQVRFDLEEVMSWMQRPNKHTKEDAVSKFNDLIGSYNKLTNEQRVEALNFLLSSFKVHVERPEVSTDTILWSFGKALDSTGFVEDIELTEEDIELDEDDEIVIKDDKKK